MVGHHQRVASHGGHTRGIVGPENALDDQLARPVVTDFLQAAPVKSRVVAASHRRCNRRGIFGLHLQTHHVFHHGHAVAQNVQQPAGVTGKVHQVACRESERDREMVAEITLALAAHRQIDRDHQGLVVRRQRTRNEAVEEGLVFEDVGLKPQASGCGPGDLLDGSCCRAGERVGNASRDRSTGDGNIAAAPAKTHCPGRRHRQRQPARGTQQLHCGVHHRHVGQHPRQQASAAKRGLVVTQGQLVFSPAIEKVKDGAWHPVPCSAAQVCD